MASSQNSEYDLGRIHISSTNGDLIIPDFDKEHEGLYQCIWDNHDPYRVELKHYDSKYTSHEKDMDVYTKFVTKNKAYFYSDNKSYLGSRQHRNVSNIISLNGKLPKIWNSYDS